MDPYNDPYPDPDRDSKVKNRLDLVALRNADHDPDPEINRLGGCLCCQPFYLLLGDIAG